MAWHHLKAGKCLTAQPDRQGCNQGNLQSHWGVGARGPHREKRKWRAPGEAPDGNRCGLVMGTVQWFARQGGERTSNVWKWRDKGNVCLKVFWKLFLLLHPMETSGERSVVREESGGKGSAVLSWLPAMPCAAAGVDAESKVCRISVQTRGWQGHICCLKNWPGGTERDVSSWMCEHVSYWLVNSWNRHSCSSDYWEALQWRENPVRKRPLEIPSEDGYF